MDGTLKPDRASQRAPEDLVAEMDKRSRRFETPCGEGHMVWRAWGEGPPVVLLHGAHGAWTHWIRNIDALAEDRTVFAADLPGFGESDTPASAQDGPRYVAPIIAGLRQLLGDRAPIDLVGFSFGGVMGAVLAAEAPDLVRRIVLVDTGGLNTRFGDISLTRVRGTQGEERRAALTHNLLGLMLDAPESVDELALLLQATNPPRGRVNPEPLVVPDKLLLALPRVRAQIDAVWGEFDRPHPDPHVQEAALRKFQPDIDFHVIPGAGHWAMYEGWQAFNPVVRALLAKPLRRA
jgi:2-hydroxy-6-oxonona-2,4-dienedioate hydrolase